MTTTNLTGAGRPTVRATLVATPEPVDAGQVVAFPLRLTNITAVIQRYEVSLLGADPGRLVAPALLDLFPDEDDTVVVQVTVPPDQDAGDHVVSLQVGPPGSDGVVVDATYTVLPVSGLTISAEPAMLETGASGSFLLHLHNVGNTPLRPELVAADPERLVDVTFDPAGVVVAGGERAVVQATASGPRPWFGMPVVRALEITATDGDTVATSMLALVQQPRISRRVVAFLGLLAMVSIFALVITLSFQRVAELSERNEALVSQGFGFDDAGAARSSPGDVGGTVLTSSGPVEGAAVELYEQANPLRPFQTTVTSPEGTYLFGNVPDGDYLIRTEVAGFDPRWHPGVLDVADAEPVAVADGVGPLDLVALLEGRAGGVSGVVTGVDVEGALLRVQLPADAIAGSDLPATPTVLQEIPLDATGRFELNGLATPATYEIVVVKPSFAPVSRTVTLQAGETRDDVELLLARGAGVVLGTVTDRAGTPLGGVDVLVSDGATELTTRTLSDDAAEGSFEVRDLAAPGTYTLTFSRAGYVPTTRTVQTLAEEPVELTVPLTSSTASISGVVTTPAGEPVASATVDVIGASLERTSRTLSSGGAGTFLLRDLPQPATYTVRVSAPGFVTTAVSVDLPGPGGTDRSGLAITLVPALGSIEGVVTDSAGSPLAGAVVTLEGPDLERTTRTADDPVGAYRLDRLPAGVYTITVARPGSTVQTLQVELAAGQDRRIGDIALETQAVVRGVVRRDGVPVLDIEVIVHRSQEYPSNPLVTTTTDADGRFTLVGLDAPQRYVLDFRTPGGEVVRSERVDLAPGEQVVLEVDL